jgi:hypothetical protein
MTKATVLLTMVILILATATAAIAAAPAAQPTATATTVTSDGDSREVRNELRTLLNQYPPELGTVLKLDPTLFNSSTYLANYPALAEFVSHHPGVAHNPAFFLEHVPGPGYQDRDPTAFVMWKQTLGELGGFVVFLVVTYVLVWMVKTLIEQRRWSRLASMQTEVHSKLLDRFTSNEELLAYVRTPAGKRFLESGPILLEAGPRPISAPVGRIFGSLQAGLVIGAAGVGIDVASFRFGSGASEPLFAIAVVAICVGFALVLSAGAFYAISRRFGLWQSPPANADAGSE